MSAFQFVLLKSFGYSDDFFFVKHLGVVSGKGLAIAAHVFLLCWNLLGGFLSGLMDLRML